MNTNMEQIAEGLAKLEAERIMANKSVMDRFLNIYSRGAAETWGVDRDITGAVDQEFRRIEPLLSHRALAIVRNEIIRRYEEERVDKAARARIENVRRKQGEQERRRVFEDAVQKRMNELQKH